MPHIVPSLIHTHTFTNLLLSATFLYDYSPTIRHLIWTKCLALFVHPPKSPKAFWSSPTPSKTTCVCIYKTVNNSRMLICLVVSRYTVLPFIILFLSRSTRLSIPLSTSFYSTYSLLPIPLTSPIHYSFRHLSRRRFACCFIVHDLIPSYHLSLYPTYLFI